MPRGAQRSSGKPSARERAGHRGGRADGHPARSCATGATGRRHNRGQTRPAAGWAELPMPPWVAARPGWRVARGELSSGTAARPGDGAEFVSTTRIGRAWHNPRPRVTSTSSAAGPYSRPGSSAAKGATRVVPPLVFGPEGSCSGTLEGRCDPAWTRPYTVETSPQCTSRQAGRLSLHPGQRAAPARRVNGPEPEP